MHDYTVNQSICLCFFSSHIVVPVCITLNNFYRLTGICSQ